MSEKCQKPAGSVQFISPSETFTPGRRVPARLECAGPRPYLMAPLNKTAAKVVCREATKRAFEWSGLTQALLCTDAAAGETYREWAEGG